ncbi:MAG: transposase [Armatimonadota bacterium]|nr:transposase [bacterium]
MPSHFRIFDQAYPHFITSTITYWLPIFCRDDYYRILTDSLNYCVQSKGLLVHAYVIMPNHFHAIVSQTTGDLSGVIRDMKKHTSKEIARKLEEDGRRMWLNAMSKAGGEAIGVRVWDEAVHPEEVHSRPFMQQKANYIHNNPVRAGFVNDPSHWKYSSAGFYYCDAESPVIVTPVE